METTNIISVVPIGKNEIKLYSNSIVTAMKNGDVDALDVFLRLKALEKISKDALGNDELKNIVVSHAEKYGKNFEYKGAVLTVSEAGVKYDFSACNDRIWNELNKQLEEIKEKIKEREQQLIALGKSGSYGVDELTGEIINPPLKTSQTIVKVEFK